MHSRIGTFLLGAALTLVVSLALPTLAKNTSSSDISKILKKVNAIQEDINSIQTDVNTLSENVDTVSSDVTSLQVNALSVNDTLSTISTNADTSADYSKRAANKLGATSVDETGTLEPLDDILDDMNTDMYYVGNNVYDICNELDIYCTYHYFDL